MVCPPPCPPPPLVPGCTSDYSSGDAKLRKIADDLREIMPLNAILPTEQITFPSVGEVSFCFTLHIRIFFLSFSLFSSLIEKLESNVFALYKPLLFYQKNISYMQY